MSVDSTCSGQLRLALLTAELFESLPLGVLLLEPVPDAGISEGFRIRLINRRVAS